MHAPDARTRFVRLSETARPSLAFSIDGAPARALAGDTLLVAMLQNTDHLRSSEFGDGLRAGFCLMGACQDCWVWADDGRRIRACSTPVSEGLAVHTRPPKDDWSRANALSQRLAAAAEGRER